MLAPSRRFCEGAVRCAAEGSVASAPRCRCAVRRNRKCRWAGGGGCGGRAGVGGPLAGGGPAKRIPAPAPDRRRPERQALSPHTRSTRTQGLEGSASYGRGQPAADAPTAERRVALATPGLNDSGGSDPLSLCERSPAHHRWRLTKPRWALPTQGWK